MNKALPLSSVTLTTPLVLGLFCTLFVLLFSYTLSNMMAPYIVGDLGGNGDISTYTITFFGIGNAIGVPLGAPLSQRIGVPKFFTACLLLFILFSWACSSSPTYPILNLARFCQGVVSGPAYALIVYILRMIPKEKTSSFTASIITLFTVVPVLGAVWGGWIAYDYDWRWGFYVETFLLILLTPFMWVQLNKYQFKTEKYPFDGIGFFFYCVGLLSLSIVFTMGQELDWYRSSLVIALTIIGVPCFLFFLLWDWHHPHPILKLRLIKNKAFSFGLLNLGGLFSLYFGTIILLAQWLIFDVNYTPIWIGFLLGIMAVTGACPVFLIREKFRLSGLDIRVNLTLAMILLAISSFYSMTFNDEINFGRIALSRLVAGFGLAFFLPPLFRICFHTFPENEEFHVMTVFQVVRAFSSAIGVAFYATLWQRRKVFFHERLGEDLTSFSEQTRGFFSHATEFQLQGQRAMEQLNTFLDRRADALALDDVFFFMGWFIIALLVLLVLTILFRMRGFVPEKQQK